MTPPADRPFIRMADIHKQFAAVHVLDGIDLEIGHGETVGLVGDNAAGKSTLMKILIGFYQADSGQIEIDGIRVARPSPAVMRRLGLEIVYQDLALEDNLDVAANIFLGRELRRSAWFLRTLDVRGMRRTASEALQRLNLDVSPRASVRRLSGGQRQAVAIARAIAFEPKLVILDEPTANLSATRVATVLQLVSRLKQLGVAVIIISHRSDELFEVADRITVIRHGRCVASRRVEDVSPAEVARLIAQGTPDDVARTGRASEVEVKR